MTRACAALEVDLWAYKSLVEIQKVVPTTGDAVVSFRKDDTYQHWDCTTGGLLGSGRVQTMPLALKCQTLWAERNACHDRLFCVIGRPGGVELSHPLGSVVSRWHADGRWVEEVLTPQGELGARCHKHVAFVHLYFGDRRVTLEESEKLSGFDGWREAFS